MLRSCAQCVSAVQAAATADTFPGVAGRAVPLPCQFLRFLGSRNLKSPSEQCAQKSPVVFPKKDSDSSLQPLDVSSWRLLDCPPLRAVKGWQVGSSRRLNAGTEPMGVCMSCPPSPDPLAVQTSFASPQFRDPTPGAARPALLGAWSPVRLSYLVAGPELRSGTPLSLLGCLDLSSSGD